MKRIILILWVALASSGWLMANHWTPNSVSYEDNMTLTGIVKIDGVEQQTTMIEVGAFCNEECRGSARLAYFPPTHRYVVQLLVFGNVGDQISFRLFDHNQNMELNLIPPDEVVFSSNGYGSLAEPYVLEFYTTPPGPYTLTVSANPTAGGTVTGGGTYDHGATATLTATPNENYRFVNWTKNGVAVSTTPSYSFTVLEAGAYVANFAVHITPFWTPASALYEDNMTLTGVVQINGVEQQNPFLEVGAFCGEECRGAGALTYFPATQRYVVQLLVFGNNGDQLTFKLYDHAQNAMLELSSVNAVSFTTNGYGTLVNPYVLNFTGTATQTYTVSATVNPEESGTVAGSGSYYQGATCTLQATPNENHTFVNWTENGLMVSVESEYSFVVNADRSLVANFAPVEDNHWTPNTALYEDNMTLTGIVQINGTEQQTTALEVGVFCGEECRGAGRLTYFPPTQRYVVQMLVYGNAGDQFTFKLFDHRQNIELNLASPDAITFSDNGYGSLANPYVLNFLEYYEITVTANPTDGGLITGAGSYVYGSTATLTATANTGYTFVNWTKNATEVSTETTYSFAVTEAGSYVANFNEVPSTITQTSNLATGWSWYSTYIEQEGIDGLAMLENSMDTACSRIQSRTEFIDNLEYMGYHFWDGTLSAITNEQSYRIRTTSPCEAVITGQPALPENHPITVNPGWNWIGFPSAQPLSVTSALSAFAPEVNDQIKGRYNFATYLGNYGGVDYWDGMLTTLEPGQGYMYRSFATTAKTLVYQTGSKGETQVNGSTEGNVYQPASGAYADNMTVTAEIELNGSALRRAQGPESYELAVFVGDECRGSVKLKYVEPLDRYEAFLMVFGDGGEELSFVLTDGEETYWSNDRVVFSANAILGNPAEPYIIRFGSSAGTDEWANRLRVYPNPVERGERFSIGMNDNEERPVRIEVINALGALVKAETLSQCPATLVAPATAGVYTLKIVVDDKTVVCKRLVVK